ncbi:MAG: GGDEF domain-containing protein [Planctomycetota bacterium]
MKEDIATIVQGVQDLPTLPAVAMQVMELLASESAEADVARVAEVISQDPALVGKILRMANSAMFGLTRKVSSVHQAVMVLGLRTIKVMVLSFSLVDSFHRKGKVAFDYRRFWRESLITAVAARHLAVTIGEVNRDEAFIAGLLADIGVLVLHERLQERYAEVMRKHREEGIDLDELERNILGLDHLDAGGYLLDSWGLPAIIVRPVGAHHDPERMVGAGEDLHVMTRILHLASLMAWVVTATQSEEPTDRLRQFAQQYFELGPERLTPIIETLRERVAETADLFAIDIGGKEALEAMRLRAQDALVRLSVGTSRELEEAQKSKQEAESRARKLEKKNRELVTLATTDPLTRVANRGELDSRLEGEMARAARLHTSIGFLLLDIDRFKLVNDTHGHDAGDQVLRGVATVVKKSVREIDLVARYGGEEFGVLCPGVTSQTLKALAERVRNCVQALSVPLRGGAKLQVTVSVGGVACTPAVHSVKPTELVKAADRLLYRAKRAGRNCTRVAAFEDVPP